MEMNQTINKIKEINLLIKNKNTKEAKIKINELIENTEKVEIDKHGQVFDFDTQIQFIYYCNQFNANGKKNIEWKKTFISEMYVIKGIILFDECNLEEALQEYKKALKWNPMKITAYMEMLEIYIKQKNITEFEKCFEKAIEIATNPLDISKLYKKYAFICIDIKDYEMAYNILKYTALIYYRKENENEITYLSSILKVNLKKSPDLGTLQYIKENKLEYKAKPSLIQSYISLAKLYEKEYADKKDRLDDRQKLNILNELIKIYDNLYFLNCDATTHSMQITAIAEYTKIYNIINKK